jgi:F0F1-type ATP synthase assembly protein I
MKNDSWNLALRFMANISGWIAFPVIIGLFLGRWFDQKFGTEPWLFLTTIGACFLVSMYGLGVNALKEFKQAEKEYGDNQDNKIEAGVKNKNQDHGGRNNS